MEISVMGTSEARTALVCRDAAFCKNINNNLNAQMGSCYAKIHFCKPIRFRCPQNFIFKAAAQSEMLLTHKVSANTVTNQTKSKPIDGVRLYVGLPLDSISICNTINHARAIMAGLRALKLLGVDGVELPVWWGIAEKEAMGIYEWSGYLALVEMVQKAGLKLHVSLCFHASKEAKIPLPKWVSQIGESQPNIFFTDRSGQCYKECLSLAVDELPVLDGNTPIQLYQKFCESFKSSFSAFMGSTITGISIGLGPDGVLQYPSQTKPAQSGKSHGAGEFQCYDENMLENLKQHAEAIGNPLWGLSGPHDVPSHDQSPISNFFEENGGPWESPYGDFFLSWYSSQLISHADRMLSIASSTFSSYPIAVSGKVPLVHSWYKTRSHPSELTAGLYNTVNRDGYEEIIEVFSRNSCLMILPGMDLLDDHQSNGSHSSPELLLLQITSACRKHGVEVSGQNSVLGGFEQIKKNLLGENQVVDLFTYQRMGASFFSPDHFPSFSAFVQGLHQPEFHSDDLRVEVAEDTVSIHGRTLQLQAA